MLDGSTHIDGLAPPLPLPSANAERIECAAVDADLGEAEPAGVVFRAS